MNSLEQIENDSDYENEENEENEADYENRIISKFRDVVKKFYLDVDSDIRQYTNNPSKKFLECVKNKYSHLKRCKRITRRTKKIEAKAYIMEILERPEIIEQFTQNERDIIYTYCVKKIKGIFKHAQSLKTGYCNLQIINGFSEINTISACITKGNLEANHQWLERLFKELNNRFPHIKLTDKIMVISSKKDDLDGNATHCKDINSAWQYLKRENNFKIIFACSNKSRLSDILEISEDFQNLNISLQKKLRIFHDEAHNPKEGIPAFRDIVENIILQQNVLSYTPISASNNTIFDEKNNLWKKNNLEKIALDYTSFDKTKSSDPHFSSCSKAIKISFEELRNNPNWRNYEIDKIPINTFMSVEGSEIISETARLNGISLDKLKNELTVEIIKYKKQNITSTVFDINEIIQNKNDYSENEIIEKIMLINIERRRTLEFCDFMKNDKEKQAVNNGLNCLNMNEILGLEYYIHNEFNIYIISTPNRRILTRYLCEEAIKKDFNPVVLGIYGNEGNKYHLMYDDEDYEVSSIMDKGEFNNKLEKLFIHLEEKNIDISRPFIINGNYNPTGESLTFVNYTYGTVRGNIRLISTNAEEDYQEASRSNYIDTKFKETDPDWVMPEKYLIGPKKFIDNALSYEAENDARIDMLGLQNNSNNNVIMSSINDQPLPEANGIVAIPIKITVDRSDDNVIEIIKIFEENTKRSVEQKIEILILLKKYVESGECMFEDKTGRFNFDNYTLKDARAYKKKENPPQKGVWKFENYKNHHNIGTSFINSTNNIQVNECEILTCIDTYICLQDGVEIEKNLKSVWWMGYKY
jgi:hypothetical protein